MKELEEFKAVCENIILVGGRCFILLKPTNYKTERI